MSYNRTPSPTRSYRPAYSAAIDSSTSSFRTNSSISSQPGSPTFSTTNSPQHSSPNTSLQAPFSSVITSLQSPFSSVTDSILGGNDASDTPNRYPADHHIQIGQSLLLRGPVATITSCQSQNWYIWLASLGRQALPEVQQRTHDIEFGDDLGDSNDTSEDGEDGEEDEQASQDADMDISVGPADIDNNSKGGEAANEAAGQPSQQSDADAANLRSRRSDAPSPEPTPDIDVGNADDEELDWNTDSEGWDTDEEERHSGIAAAITTYHLSLPSAVRRGMDVAPHQETYTIWASLPQPRRHGSYGEVVNLALDKSYPHFSCPHIVRRPTDVPQYDETRGTRRVRDPEVILERPDERLSEAARRHCANTYDTLVDGPRNPVYAPGGGRNYIGLKFSAISSALTRVFLNYNGDLPLLACNIKSEHHIPIAVWRPSIPIVPGTKFIPLGKHQGVVVIRAQVGGEEPEVEFVDRVAEAARLLLDSRRRGYTVLEGGWRNINFLTQVMKGYMADEKGVPRIILTAEEADRESRVARESKNARTFDGYRKERVVDVSDDEADLPPQERESSESGGGSEPEELDGWNMQRSTPHPQLPTLANLMEDIEMMGVKCKSQVHPLQFPSIRSLLVLIQRQALIL